MVAQKVKNLIQDWLFSNFDFAKQLSKSLEDDSLLILDDLSRQVVAQQDTQVKQAKHDYLVKILLV